MTQNDDIGFGCFISVIGGVLLLLISLGVGLVFLTAQQAIGISILFGLVGMLGGNWALQAIDNFFKNRNRK